MHRLKGLGSNIGRALPILGSVFTFLMYVAMGGELTVDVVFPTITVFQGMRMSLVGVSFL